MTVAQKSLTRDCIELSACDCPLAPLWFSVPGVGTLLILLLLLLQRLQRLLQWPLQWPLQTLLLRRCPRPTLHVLRYGAGLPVAADAQAGTGRWGGNWPQV